MKCTRLEEAIISLQDAYGLARRLSLKEKAQELFHSNPDYNDDGVDEPLMELKNMSSSRAEQDTNEKKKIQMRSSSITHGGKTKLSANTFIKK